VYAVVATKEGTPELTITSWPADEDIARWPLPVTSGGEPDLTACERLMVAAGFEFVTVHKPGVTVQVCPWQGSELDFTAMAIRRTA
jgi:hypothetical protein